jgi:uncharacterized protein
MMAASGEERRKRMSEAERASGVDVKMLELLACPLTKGPLIWDAGRCELVSKLAKLAYPVRDGIPVMLPSEARAIDPNDLPATKPAGQQG